MVAVLGIPSEEAVGAPTLSTPLDWWASSYVYRRLISVTPMVEAVPADHPIWLELGINRLSQGKVRSDAQDVEVVLLTDSGWSWLGRNVSTYVDTLSLSFATLLPIALGETAAYYVYYGNPIGEGFDRPSGSGGTRVQIPYDDPRVAYTRPAEQWHDGATTTHGAQASFAFHGTDVFVWAHRGPSSPRVRVQLDDTPWQRVDTTFVVEYDLPIFWAFDLAQDKHRLRVSYAGGSSPRATDQALRLVRFEYGASLSVTVGPEEVHVTGWRGGGVGAGGG